MTEQASLPEQGKTNPRPELIRELEAARLAQAAQERMDDKSYIAQSDEEEPSVRSPKDVEIDLGRLDDQDRKAEEDFDANQERDARPE